MMALRLAEVSRSSAKPTSSRLSTLLMSAEEIREVSSSISSMPVPETMRSDMPRVLPCRRTRVVTSSSR